MDALADLATGLVATLVVIGLGLTLRITAILAALSQASRALGGPENLDRWVVNKLLPQRWLLLAPRILRNLLGICPL